MRAPHRDRIAPAALPFLDPQIAERHRVAICSGDTCPRCGSRETGPWGGFSGRRRFRCRACGRTFSTFTGTPLCYLKRLETWRPFLACIDARDSVRRSAERLGIDPGTAFRWRHRLLEDWRRRDRTRLTGRVYLETMCMAYNRKGCRRATAAARARRYLYPSWIPQHLRVYVALLWQNDRATLARASVTGDLPGIWLDQLLPPLLRGVAELVADVYMPEAFAREVPDVAILQSSDYVPARRPARLHLERRFRRWLRPFRGVATKYLERYLQWFRSDLRRAVQQFPRTPAQRPPPRTGPSPAAAASARPAARFVIPKTIRSNRLRTHENTTGEGIMTKRPDQHNLDQNEAQATDYKFRRQTEDRNRRGAEAETLEGGRGNTMTPNETMQARREQSEQDRERELERAAGVKERGEGNHPSEEGPDPEGDRGDLRTHGARSGEGTDRALGKSGRRSHDQSEPERGKGRGRSA